MAVVRKRVGDCWCSEDNQRLLKQLRKVAALHKQPVSARQGSPACAGATPLASWPRPTLRRSECGRLLTLCMSDTCEIDTTSSGTVEPSAGTLCSEATQRKRHGSARQDTALMMGRTEEESVAAADLTSYMNATELFLLHPGL